MLLSSSGGGGVVGVLARMRIIGIGARGPAVWVASSNFVSVAGDAADRGAATRVTDTKTLRRILKALPASTVPKSPANSYSLFCRDVWPIIKAESATPMPFINVSAECARRWKALTPAQLEVYTSRQEALRKNHAAALDAYIRGRTADDIVAEEVRARVDKSVRSASNRNGKKTFIKRRGLSIRDPDRPKRPPTAFSSFVGDLYNDVPDALAAVGGPARKKEYFATSGMNGAFKLLAAVWHADGGLRERYTERYAVKAAEFKKAMAEYRQKTGIDESWKNLRARVNAVIRAKAVKKKKVLRKGVRRAARPAARRAKPVATNKKKAAAAKKSSKTAAASKKKVAVKKSAVKKAAVQKAPVQKTAAVKKKVATANKTAKVKKTTTAATTKKVAAAKSVKKAVASKTKVGSGAARKKTIAVASKKL